MGTSADIEALVGWTGEAGVLTRALVDAGVPEGFGFLEPVGNGFKIVDLWRFAPEWAWRRYQHRRDHRLYRQRHPELMKAERQSRRARLKGAGGLLTASEWQDILVEFDNRCAYCGDVLIEATQDHVTPLSRGGRHERSNVVPACRVCNSSKGSKTADEFRAMR